MTSLFGKFMNIENTVKEIIKNEFGEKVKNIENKLNEKIKDLNQTKSSLDSVGNNIKSQTNFNSEIDKYIQNNETIKKISENINSLKNRANNNNFIEITCNISKSKKFKLLQQSNTYKNFFNFERDDLELIIDGENASLDNFEKNNYDEYFNYYLYFRSGGIHTIKVIFRKKLYNCDSLFMDCEDIIEIDMPNFDSSQVISCQSMFQGCSSLRKINLGKLGFSLCKNFEHMFLSCYNLENIDVSHFITKNAITFRNMFNGCTRLKNIDVSKFNSSKCESIESMFKDCRNL